MVHFLWVYTKPGLGHGPGHGSPYGLLYGPPFGPPKILQFLQIGLRHNTPNTPSRSLLSSRTFASTDDVTCQAYRRETGENDGKFEDSPIVFGSKPSPLTRIAQLAWGRDRPSWICIQP